MTEFNVGDRVKTHGLYLPHHDTALFGTVVVAGGATYQIKLDTESAEYYDVGETGIVHRYDWEMEAI